jgi:hypothetical protein
VLLLLMPLLTTVLKQSIDATSAGQLDELIRAFSKEYLLDHPAEGCETMSALAATRSHAAADNGDDSSDDDVHDDSRIDGRPVDLIPAMPSSAPDATQHRRRDDEAMPTYNAMVARPVRPAEVKTNPIAMAAMQAEWDRLRSVVRPDGTFGCWDEHYVREWRDVRAEARRKGEKANVGLVYGIVVEKNAELDESDPRRKMKGRAVFQGNAVRDEYGDAAIFQELSSCPATMEAARCADAYGLAYGNDVEQSDAVQAYTQAWLEGTDTWIRLPRDQWPAQWAGYEDPVCPLRLALYGHPDSGGHWERHCTAHLTSVGFVEIDN